jgi:hypothetical protein
VSGAYRKGITTYSNTPGTVTNLVIDAPVISGCGLGGLYLAAVTSTTDQKAIVINGLISHDNYNNLLIAECTGVVGGGIILKDSTGGDGLNVVDSVDVTLNGVIVQGSYVKGIFVDGCTRVSMPNASVTDANTSINAFGPAVHVSDSTYTGFPGLNVSGSDHTHGVIEDGTTNYSDFSNVLCNGATSANYTLVGSSSYLRVRQTGIVAVASVAALNLPVGFTLFSITGTTNITSITALGHGGQTVTLIFAGILTVTDGGNLKLAGNFVTTADDVITLTCDGTNWYEVSRSVN